MTLTEAQVDELEKVAAPLMAWIEKNCHPHVHVIVDGQDRHCLKRLQPSGRTLQKEKDRQVFEAPPSRTTWLVLMYALNPSPESAIRFIVDMFADPAFDNGGR
jgi:hypothetical protein